jgi:hypothetical protein
VEFDPNLVLFAMHTEPFIPPRRDSRVRQQLCCTDRSREGDSLQGSEGAAEHSEVVALAQGQEHHREIAKAAVV